MGANINRIKAYRALHNLKQQDIADLLHISLTAYCAKEQGRVDFTSTEIGTMAKEFDIDPGELFSTESTLK